ncbi:Sigma factor RpoE negative regulatory protein RseA [Candidatus Burkholderia humilis]|nr:Sigma factor RpoE negative regulatory protein RseA [Candidatus Burkholderia humilis]
MGSASMQNAANQAQSISRGECMSAFADGESLDEIGNLGQFLAELTSRDRTAWSDYHLIGDALRSDDLAESSAFMAAFSVRFESEAHVLAPAASASAVIAQKRGNVFRRRFVPAFAVAAAVAMLTWIVVPQLQGVDNHGGAQIASVSTGGDSVHRVAMASVPAASARPVVEANIIRDADLDQYLEAHQQFSQQPAMPSMSLIRAAAVSQSN